MTFAENLIKEAAPEIIEKIIIGEMGWSGYGEEGKEVQLKSQVLDWETAFEILNYNYDTGYGAPDCHAVYAYTKTRVIFISQYDGATNICSIPRNPIECMPIMPGG